MNGNWCSQEQQLPSHFALRSVDFRKKTKFEIGAI